MSDQTLSNPENVWKLKGYRKIGKRSWERLPGAASNPILESLAAAADAALKVSPTSSSATDQEAVEALAGRASYLAGWLTSDLRHIKNPCDRVFLETLIKALRLGYAGETIVSDCDN